MSYRKSIEAHYVRNWGKPVERVSFPRFGLAPEFQVLVIPKSEDTTAYATCCMSQPDDRFRLELFLLARRGASPGPAPGSGPPPGSWS